MYVMSLFQEVYNTFFPILPKVPKQIKQYTYIPEPIFDAFSILWTNRRNGSEAIKSLLSVVQHKNKLHSTKYPDLCIKKIMLPIIRKAWFNCHIILILYPKKDSLGHCPRHRTVEISPGCCYSKRE